jgi:dihydroorotate dehydrogenase
MENVSPRVPVLRPVVISAPFGNYVQPAGTTPTLGTFTAAARPGRLWRILKTVRYYPRIKAWVNKIGLRNPGLPWLIDRVEAGRKDVSDKLVSIHGFTPDEWWALLEGIERIKPLGVELNMSCPNVGHIDWPAELFERALATGVSVIAKLPPVNYGDMLAQAIEAGVRCFHCCNTLPVPAGGVSGKPLKPVSLTVIRDLRARSFGKNLTIIGGGGIYEPSDIDDYRVAGADHFALGTKVMHPKYLWSHRALRPLIDATC